MLMNPTVFRQRRREKRKKREGEEEKEGRRRRDWHEPFVLRLS